MTSNPRETRLADVVVSPSISIGEALACLDRAGTGALALCASDQKLVGLLSDGDIRRAILNAVALGEPCSLIANSEPIVALEPVDPGEALKMMNQHDIHHLPVVDAKGILV